MRGRHFFKIVLSFLLAVIMAVQPIMVDFCYAAETTTAVAKNGTLSQNESEGVTDEEGDSDVSDVIETGNETEPVDETEKNIVSDNTPESVSENETGTVSDNTTETVSNNETETVSDDAAVSVNATVSVNTTVTISENTVEFSMPEDYILSEEQLLEKSKLSENLTFAQSADEGTAYAEKEALFLADTIEEATKIAQGYNADLTSYEYGVGVITFHENGMILKAMTAAADMNNNLPAVWPNYFRYANEASEFEDIKSDDLLEVIEEPCEEVSENSVRVGNYDVPISIYNEQLREIDDSYLQYDSEYYQWHHATVGSVYAWNEGFTGSGVKVAVLDTGITPIDSELNLAGSRSFTDNIETVDTYGHGTQVAAVIGAKINGIKGSGIAPDAELYNIRALNQEGKGSDAGIIRGINYALQDLHVDLINMSFSSVYYSGATQTAIMRAYESGVTVVAAAGNAGQIRNDYPAAYDHVLSVAATDRYNQRTEFTNYGYGIDLAAPGMSVFSACNDGEYRAQDGTSMACPIVTGEAAVILSAYPEIKNMTGKSRVDALEKTLKDNTISAGAGMGAGIVSLTSALKVTVVYKKPKTPNITATNGSDNQSVTVAINSEKDTSIYYTTNGKTPSFKNGLPSTGAIKSGNSTTIKLEGGKKFTVKAIAVNDCGMSSSVKSVSVTLKPRVSGITITGVNRIALGKSTQLKATVTPSYAASKAVKWTIDGDSKTTGVSVSKSGKVTAKKSAVPGTYKVTATAKDQSGKSGTYTVTVIQKPIVKSVAVNKKSIELILPGTSSVETFSNLKAVPFVSGANPGATDFYWTSSKTSVATVSATGKVNAVKAGTTTITALSNDGNGKKATFKVVVKQQVTGISIEGVGEVAAGKSVKLKANVNPTTANNKSLKWSIAPEGQGVTVNGGVVKATAKAKAGKYTISAEAKDGSGKIATKEITVTAGAISSIKLSSASQKIYRVKGNSNAPTSAAFTATIAGANGFSKSAYIVKNSNPGIVSVGASGSSGTVTVKVTATGNATGSSTIIIASTDGSNKKATFKVKVVNPVSEVSLSTSKGRQLLAQGTGLQIKANLTAGFGPISSKKVKWSISNAAGLKISSSGKVSATSKTPIGAYTVTATADGGASATYEVIVNYRMSSLRISGITNGRAYWANQDLDTEYYFKILMGYKKDGYIPTFTSTSSNKKVCAARVVDTPLSDGATYRCIGLRFLKQGTSNIKLTVNDGTNMSVSFSIEVR